jgi:hypothetical protein
VSDTLFHTLFCVLILGISTIGDMLLLGGNLSSDRLGEIHDPRRLRIRRPKVFREKCDPSVIAKVLKTKPIDSSELYEGQLLSPVQHPARYRNRRGEVL